MNFFYNLALQFVTAFAPWIEDEKTANMPSCLRSWKKTQTWKLEGARCTLQVHIMQHSYSGSLWTSSQFPYKEKATYFFFVCVIVIAFVLIHFYSLVKAEMTTPDPDSFPFLYKKNCFHFCLASI